VLPILYRRSVIHPGFRSAATRPRGLAACGLVYQNPSRSSCSELASRVWSFIAVAAEVGFPSNLS